LKRLTSACIRAIRIADAVLELRDFISPSRLCHRSLLALLLLAVRRVAASASSTLLNADITACVILQ